MAEDKKEPWLNHLALTTVILAVCATLATFKGGGYSTKSVISQAQASDQWAFYQAKAIKGDLYQVELDALQTTLATLPATTPLSVKQVYQSKIDDYQARVTKYAREKSQIQKQAQQLEQS